jgi:hypothetical protein
MVNNVGRIGEMIDTRSDPRKPNNSHFCVPLLRSAMVGKQAMIEQRNIVAQTGKGTAAAISDGLAAVDTSRFQLPTEVRTSAGL